MINQKGCEPLKKPNWNKNPEEDQKLKKEKLPLHQKIRKKKERKKEEKIRGEEKKQEKEMRKKKKTRIIILPT